MFKCCLCGREYEREELVVKCVNKCGRENFLDGKFQHKQSKNGGETTNLTFNFNIDYSTSIEKEIEKILEELFCFGMSKIRIETLRKRIFADWEEKSEQEKEEELGRLKVMRKLF